MDIWDRGTEGNVVKGNYVGTSADGTDPLPNGWSGISIGGGTTKNIVGPDNVIAFNTYNGVWIGWTDASAIENTITRNAIYGHPYAGIKLVSGGNLEFFAPILTNVTDKTVSGLASPNSTVEIFSDDDDEGRTYEGTTTADTNGDFSYAQATPFTRPNVTATATDANGNTSEFSGAYAPRESISPPSSSSSPVIR